MTKHHKLKSEKEQCRCERYELKCTGWICFCINNPVPHSSLPARSLRTYTELNKHVLYMHRMSGTLYVMSRNEAGMTWIYHHTVSSVMFQLRCAVWCVTVCFAYCMLSVSTLWGHTHIHTHTIQRTKRETYKTLKHGTQLQCGVIGSICAALLFHISLLTPVFFTGLQPLWDRINGKEKKKEALKTVLRLAAGVTIKWDGSL